MAIACSICRENLIIKRKLNIRRSTDMFESNYISDANLVNESISDTFNSASSITSDKEISGIDYMSVTAEESSRIEAFDETVERLCKTNFLNEGFCCYDTSSLPYYEITLGSTNHNFDKRKLHEISSNYSETTLTGIVSNSSLQSYVTVVEEYVYKDVEKDVEFIERRFPGSSMISWSSSTNQSSTFYTLMNSTINSENNKIMTEETKDSLPESVINLSGKKLRTKLIELGFNPGPVTETTCKVLQKYYHKLRTRPRVTAVQDESNIAKTFSIELEKFCSNTTFDMSYYELLNEKMSKPFENHDGLSWWRNGNHKTCFNYILLDPRITSNLALRRKISSTSELFQKFLSSVFYIGKGTRSRPYSHLYEALSENSKTVKKLKVQKIKEIWTEGLGVVSLHIFQNTIPVEAWTREASMISAFGLSNLTNSIQGTFYGPASTWTKKDQRKLGSFSLFQAFNILLFEGERQIYPNDIPISKWNH